MSDLDAILTTAYGFDEPSIEFGHAITDGAPHGSLPIRLPLRMLNRHGLIAGATGTGKTRSLQLLAEACSRNGIPAFVSDVKGDLSGIAAAAAPSPKLVERMARVEREFKPEAFPVEYFSLTGNAGAQLRATVSSFGPILLAKVLDLTETQQSVLALVFKYCDDRALPLLDFKDLREVLNYLTSDEGKLELKREYGGISPASVGVLFRKMVELEQQGADRFFGEPELDLADVMRTAPDGRGIVSILTLSDVQDKPRLYSTFLMWMLGRLYYDLPEIGDADKPKLVFFFDEAHQLFEDSSSALVEHIEQIARLIRSKGVGVFFITQTPKDVDEDVLAQLGNRVQHAVRVLTPKEAKNVRATASTFPPSPHLDIERALPALGIGEALISFLTPKGAPNEAAVAQVAAPSSSMEPLESAEHARRVAGSAIAAKYRAPVDRESAHEILSRKLETARIEEPQPRETAPAPRAPRTTRRRQTLGDKVVGNVTRQATRTITSIIARELLGILGVGRSRRR
ncbi:MAG TPA: helicase HerA-like domain-containing protein [Thermoanaerobaculia bacterium]|nr:helicase HerA-like domain-containing protein [Thermoanaerobaculia bacterium]